MPLKNCEVYLILTWSEDCVITDMTTQDADPHANPPVPNTRAPIDATIAISDTKL